MFKFKNIQIFPPLTALQKYRVFYTVLLSLVPVFCGALVVALLSVFAKLNLYFLESNGLILDEQVRDAYYSQMQLEVLNVTWFLGLQFLAAAVASYVIVKWSSAPFISAQKLIRTAIDKPENLKPQFRWLSESQSFDRTIWQFALQIKNKSAFKIEKEKFDYENGINILYFIKFMAAFVALSISMGYVTGIIIVSMYEKIVSLSIQLLQSRSDTSHYYLAQTEILLDATNVAVIISIILYLIIGLRISSYMSSMTFVFSRAVREGRLPIYLRKPDIYGGLADVLNEGFEKIKK